MWWLLLFACGDDPADPVRTTSDPTETTPDPTTPDPTGTTPDPTGTPTDCAAGELATTTGCLQGISLPSGREQLLGIPYAEPPVGDLRLRPPVPIAPWSGTRDATVAGPVCVQFSDSFFGDLSVGDGAEDCLTLNITRPKDAADLPILFFIHGGGHIGGAGSEEHYLGDPGLASDAVVVTINYRLGPLGFLAHPALSAEDADGVSGNLGLRDVQTALRWVNDNAALIGGDPSRILVFGESAGGLQTCGLLTSPAAAGLFSAAIIQSAPCSGLSAPLRDPPLFVTSAEQQGESFVDQLGCTGDVPACLRDAPLADLVALGQTDVAVGPAGGDWSWAPALDGVWLPLDVPAALQQGDWNQVPVLATVNADEGTIFTLGFAPDQAALDAWTDSYALLLGVDADDLAALYDPADYGGSTEAAYAALFGDIAFVCPTVWQQEAIAGQVAARGGFWAHDDIAVFGAFHASEIPYVFGTDLGLLDPAELALSDAMQDAWTAMSGPSPSLAGLGPWPELGGWVQLDVGSPGTIASPRAEQCAFFEDSRGNPYR